VTKLIQWRNKMQRNTITIMRELNTPNLRFIARWIGTHNLSQINPKERSFYPSPEEAQKGLERSLDRFRKEGVRVYDLNKNLGTYLISPSDSDVSAVLITDIDYMTLPELGKKGWIVSVELRGPIQPSRQFNEDVSKLILATQFGASVEVPVRLYS